MASLCCIWRWSNRQRAHRTPDVVEQFLCTQRFVLSFEGISALNLNKLQRVQNLAAKIALNDWHSPSQELFSQLHSRIKLNFPHSLIAESQPINLRSLIISYVPPRFQRSSDKSLLVPPPTRTSIGKRAFSVPATYV